MLFILSIVKKLTYCEDARFTLDGAVYVRYWMLSRTFSSMYRLCGAVSSAMRTGIMILLRHA